VIGWTIGGVACPVAGAVAGGGVSVGLVTGGLVTGGFATGGLAGCGAGCCIDGGSSCTGSFCCAGAALESRTAISEAAVGTDLNLEGMAQRIDHPRPPIKEQIGKYFTRSGMEQS
jgi:hypothetical protein